MYKRQAKRDARESEGEDANTQRKSVDGGSGIKTIPSPKGLKAGAKNGAGESEVASKAVPVPKPMPKPNATPPKTSAMPSVENLQISEKPPLSPVKPVGVYVPPSQRRNAAAEDRAGSKRNKQKENFVNPRDDPDYRRDERDSDCLLYTSPSPRD